MSDVWIDDPSLGPAGEVRVLPALAALLRIRRTALCLTQRQVATALHCTGDAVSKWERGVTTPDLAVYGWDLCRVLGIKPDDLLRQAYWQTRGDKRDE